MARTQFRLSMPVPAEFDLHKQIADCLRVEIGPPGRISKLGVVWYSQDVADSGSSAPGARVARGLIAGLPDLVFLYHARTHFQEIKTPTGVLSEAQEIVIAMARLAGVEIGICWDAQSCLMNLDVWQIPRARRVRFAIADNVGVADG